MRRFFILFSAAVVLYLSVSYWYLPNTPYSQYSLEHVSSYVIKPIGNINIFLQKISEGFSDLKCWFLNRKVLNQRITNIDAIESELQQVKIELSASQRIIDQLAPLVKFSCHKNFQRVTTRVYGSPVGFYNSQIVAGATSEVSIKKDDVAVTLKGLVGRVIESSNRIIRIMLITDMASRVPVKILETNENGIAVGSGASVMTLEHLQSREMITNNYKRPPEIGDVLVTSGIGGVFPPDLPVGVVASIKDNEITIKPFVIFHTLELVTILYDHTEL